jgi:hypothetical protein
MYVGLAVLTPIFRVQCVALWLGFDIECPIHGGREEGEGRGRGGKGDLPFKEIYLKLELKEEVLLENLHKIRQGIYMLTTLFTASS